jgi:hypothetical protein
MPRRPRARPSVMRSVGRGPPGRSQSKRTIQTGTVATMSAAIPDGTRCSAQVTPPFPPPSRSAPITAAEIQ